MASASSAGNADLGEQPSTAQLLAQKHQVTVEDAPDEEARGGSGTSWGPTMSAKAAGKQKAAEPSVALDTQSHELFPELGGSKKTTAAVTPPVWKPKSTANGKTNGDSSAANGSSRASTPASGTTTPAGSARPGPPSVSIPGRNVEHVVLEPHHILARNQLKRPVPDIIKDINRKSRATVNEVPLPGGRRKFEAAGPPEAAVRALKELVQLIGAKQTIKVPIPQAARAHIIGKQGATIKALQEKTGAKIQLPKVDDLPYPLDDDDDAEIHVIVEGNAYAAEEARMHIQKIVGERGSNVSTKVKGVPAEFFPFIAGPGNGFVSSLENRGVQIRVPPHQWRSSQPPTVPAAGERPRFQPSAESHIQLAGDRAAVQAARAEIERLAEELHEQLELDQLELPKGRHEFIIGNRGKSAEEFLGETGCVIILPTDEEDDMVTIIGPAGDVDKGKKLALDLATSMNLSNYDISRLHQKVPGGAAVHARHVTRYLRQRGEIDRLEKAYDTHINTPFTSEGASPWELYSREGKNAFSAQKEIRAIVTSHPPARIGAIPVDPFFHQFLRSEVGPRVAQDYGTCIVLPEATERSAPVLLVYEGSAEADTRYQVPRDQVPSQAQIDAFKQGIRAAQDHIGELIAQHGAIETRSLDIPQKFHDKLKRFIKREQEKRSANQASVRVTNVGSTVTFRGAAEAVQSLVAKVEAFVAQEKEDEKERGFTLSFDFPQKFANHLIGKGGSNIRELRDKFDVDIQVQDGKVELKGPAAKAEAAKKDILALGRQLEDEVTHTLKIEPEFHREFIGTQGSTINRLQTQHSVLIFFPRSAKGAKDDESNADASSDVGKPRRHQNPDEVIIRGPKKGADAARKEIKDTYEWLKERSFTATVSIQQKQLPSLIGQRGAALEKLRQETGATIDIPNGRDEQIVEVQIKGTKDQVKEAKGIIEKKKLVFDDTITETIDVDRKYHKALIGPGGTGIRDLVHKARGSETKKKGDSTDDQSNERELSRAIQFPKQESDGSTIKIEGRKSFVENVIAEIRKFVSERESQVTESVEVPVEKHRSLIGRGGETKRGMESQFGVSIDVPRQGGGQTAVNISGQPDGVEKAKAHILSLIKEKHAETVQVPRGLHHAVSNNGQFFRKMRSDHQVTIDHAGQTAPSRAAPQSNPRANGGSLPLITDDTDAPDAHAWEVVESTSVEDGEIPWVFHGTPEKVEKAKKALEAALEQAKKGNTTGYLTMHDPRTHRHVIGHGGRKVDSIRKQSGCRINVPHGKETGEAIEIVGTKEGVEKAKDLVLAAVRDGLKSRE